MAGPVCPNCKRPLDPKGRCWRCCDRACSACGGPTGSAFIAMCIPCGRADDRADDVSVPTPTDRWVIVLEAEPGPVPVAVRVRHLLKFAKRQQGLRCVALPSAIPDGTRTDEVLEEE